MFPLQRPLVVINIVIPWYPRYIISRYLIFVIFFHTITIPIIIDVYPNMIKSNNMMIGCPFQYFLSRSRKCDCNSSFGSLRTVILIEDLYSSMLFNIMSFTLIKQSHVISHLGNIGIMTIATVIGGGISTTLILFGKDGKCQQIILGRINIGWTLHNECSRCFPHHLNCSSTNFIFVIVIAKVGCTICPVWELPLRHGIQVEENKVCIIDNFH
mmetsp:Transcript_2728/g.5091  ORF Transcript_2728/g.5091 Transcript_2728/m.5091 type:complete len:213 (-) Transcript_2728:929-1567(-)